MRRRPLATVSLLALSLLAATACGKAPAKSVESGAPASSSSAPRRADGTTTSVPATPTWPLTGQPLADPAAANHPALVVKMDNSPDARPQTGINEADIVYELLVEGITRYALVYHSTPADPVGPVRSARSSDLELTANLSRPLIAWSGGNPGVVGAVHAAVGGGFLVDVGADAASGDYYRDHSRVAPHNLYTSVTALWDHYTPSGTGAPLPLFEYRGDGVASSGAGVETPGFAIDFGGVGVRAEYVWDAERHGWDRFQTDQRHSRPFSATVDSNGVQVAPANVVIMFVPYGQSPADSRSPMAMTSGEGDAIVLTDGKVVTGRWKRPNALSGWQLVDSQGQPILLTPGHTWVGLPENGSLALPIDPSSAQELLGYRR